MNEKNNAMETMKAVTQETYGGPDVLKIAEVQKPIPKKDELLIRIHSTPITAAGSFMREGTPLLGRLAIGLFKPKSKIPGVGFSGEVEAVGEDVKLFSIGDKVFGETLFNQGTQAEYVCASHDDVIAIKPNNITHAEAAPIIDGHLTSMNYLTKVTAIQPGQSILIIGASGSLGTAAVQIAADKGANVIGVCSSSNIELVKSLGAHTVIDYTKKDFTKESVKYDVIYDTVGKSTFNRCKPLLTENGVYMAPVLSFKLLFQSMWTSLFGKKKAKFSATGLEPKHELKKMLIEIQNMISDEKLMTVIDRKYTFEQVAEAHAYVDTGHKRGNVILQVDH